MATFMGAPPLRIPKLYTSFELGPKYRQTLDAQNDKREDNAKNNDDNAKNNVD